jgi:H+/Cl- antiporter ClcA
VRIFRVNFERISSLTSLLFYNDDLPSTPTSNLSLVAFVGTVAIISVLLNPEIFGRGRGEIEMVKHEEIS